MLSSLRQDLIYAVRSFSHSPGLVAAVVISIGLGIGANTTVFSLVNELILRDVPVRDPQSLYTLAQGKSTSFSWPDYLDYRQTSHIFEGLAAHCPVVPVNMKAGGAAQRVWGQMVSGNYFNLVGPPLALGRGIVPAEDEIEMQNPVVVLGHGLWQRLGAKPDVLGTTVRLSGHPYTVIGVTAPGFFGTDRGLMPEFWAPLAMRGQLWPDVAKMNEAKRSSHWIEFTARLKPGVSREQATAALNVIANRIAAEEDKTKHPTPIALTTAGHFPDIGPLVKVLMSALSVVVALVLLIACANVANLLLARSATRRREMGLRLSLGASRARLVRQLLTESVLLSAAGATLGFLLALPGAKALSAFQLPIPIPIRFDFAPDTRVLLYTTALAVLAGILFGLAPALTSTRESLASAIRTSGLGNGGTRGGKLGTVLVGVQVTLSLILLVASGLFLRNLQAAASIELGMRPQGVLMFSVDTKAQGYTDERAAQFFLNVGRRVSAIPGVQSFSYSNIAPLSLASSTHGFRNADDDKKATTAAVFMVGPRYFETMGMRMHAGRDFTGADGKAKLALINQTMATRLFGAENPIGRHVKGGGDKTGNTYEVIGIVGDSKAVTLGEEQRACIFRYFPTDFGESL